MGPNIESSETIRNSHFFPDRGKQSYDRKTEVTATAAISPLNDNLTKLSRQDSISLHFKSCYQCSTQAIADNYSQTSANNNNNSNNNYNHCNGISNCGSDDNNSNGNNSVDGGRDSNDSNNDNSDSNNNNNNNNNKNNSNNNQNSSNNNNGNNNNNNNNDNNKKNNDKNHNYDEEDDEEDKDNDKDKDKDKTKDKDIQLENLSGEDSNDGNNRVSVTPVDTAAGSSNDNFSEAITKNDQKGLENEKEREPKKIVPVNLNIEMYKIVRTLGTGSFGRVVLAELPEKNVDGTPKFAAIKIMKKFHVIKTKQVKHSKTRKLVEHVFNELDILSKVKFPFIVELYAAFYDTHSIYLVLEYVTGGELFTYLHTQGTLPSKTVKFYIASLILALEYMHNIHIMYRDLKPENLLLDSQGYLRITDFGFSKIVLDRTWTLCGTPEYLAPEVIISKGYNHAADWWALGVLMYELLVGKTPFAHQTPMGTYTKILCGKIFYPPKIIQPLEKDLISKLCCTDLTRRIGNMLKKDLDIKNHEWFADIDWDQLLAMKLPPPIQPRNISPGDASNYDMYPEEELQNLPVEDDPYHTTFENFTYNCS